MRMLSYSGVKDVPHEVLGNKGAIGVSQSPQPEKNFEGAYATGAGPDS
jgi:hypothetical protein